MQSTVKLVLKISQLLGIAPVSFEDKKEKFIVSLGWKCYSVLMASLLLILIYCGVTRRLSQVYSSTSDLALRIDTFNVILGDVTGIFLILVSITLKQRHLDVWCMNLLSVDVFLYKNVEQEYFKMSKLVRRIILGVTLISLTLYVGFMWLYKFHLQFDVLIPIYFCYGVRNTFIVQFFTFNVILYRRFQHMNKHLLDVFCVRSEYDLDYTLSLLLKIDMRNFSVFAGKLRTKDSYHLSRRQRLSNESKSNIRLQALMSKFRGCAPLSHLQKVHCLLHGMARCVSGAFGLQIVSEVTFCFLNIVMNTYVMLSHFLRNGAVPCGEPTGVVLLECLPWTLMAVLRLVIIACSSEAVVRQSNRTLELVNKLLLLPSQGDYGRHTALQKFANQLRLSPLSYSAAGLFLIDRSLLTSCVATITTYLVILVQFSLAKMTMQQNNYGC
ncbi:gustatory receptor for sugar taste 43a-like [Schistocerca nitens]|uniref:gustatory receptor for sugar taste 43a-like n=1 Tax=Schistocerca nitens TaxID=7011 RepID=UPI0021173F0F|nr:gustatory receptor for sugar taste 43a-like [Schistocerca nitens]